MYPWSLHHRLLLAFVLPVALLLISQMAMISHQFHEDMHAGLIHRRALVLQNTAIALRSEALSAATQREHLGQLLQGDDLRRLTVVGRDGRILADAGASYVSLPSAERLKRFTPGRHQLEIGDDVLDLQSLPGGRWLILTSSQQMLRLAFYERLVQHVLLAAGLLAALAWLLFGLLRRALHPLNTFVRQLDHPEALTTRQLADAERTWPELVSRIVHHHADQQRKLQALRQDSEHAEAELRETLEAIERQNIELHAARRSAQASNQLKSEFLANISHEIRTPLTSLLGFARLLERTPLSSTQQEHVGALSRSGEHLLAILNDLLDLSKIEAGRLVLDETPLQLNSLIKDTAAMLAPLIGDKPVRLTVECAAESSEPLLGDPLRLRQICTNLLSNAIKFTARGEIQVSLRVLDRDDARVRCQLSIRDTGIGIEPERLQSLFDAFEQADTSISRHFGGTGLGLTITRQLVHLLGGQLDALSTPGRGSEFIVSWWAARDPFQQGHAHAALSYPLQAPAPSLATAPLRVLVVDDHPANLQLMRVWLQEMGIAVSTAENGADAIARAAATVFDLIFMDIQMPIMNGLDAAQAIRAQERGGQRVPIIALTAHALSSEREYWLRNGIDDYLSKPLDESQLHHVLLQWTRYTGQPASVIDWAEAERLAGGRRELAEQLLRTLLDDLPGAKSQLQEAVDLGDATAWHRAVHRLLGACRYTGVPSLRTALEAALLIPDHGCDPALQQRITQEMDALLQCPLPVVTRTGG